MKGLLVPVLCMICVRTSDIKGRHFREQEATGLPYADSWLLKGAKAVMNCSGRMPGLPGSLAFYIRCGLFASLLWVDPASYLIAAEAKQWPDDHDRENNKDESGIYIETVHVLFGKHIAQLSGKVAYPKHGAECGDKHYAKKQVYLLEAEFVYCFNVGHNTYPPKQYHRIDAVEHHTFHYIQDVFFLNRWIFIIVDGVVLQNGTDAQDGQESKTDIADDMIIVRQFICNKRAAENSQCYI